MSHAVTVDAHAFAGAVAAWRGASVWVVGDVMLDVWVRGDAGRISPEAPVPVVHVKGRSASAGGAAHVARNIVALGGRAILAGVIGADQEGAELRQRCHDVGIETNALVEVVGRPTTSKVRVMAQEQQLLRYDVEVATPIAGDTEAALVAALHAATRPDAIIISDYAKGVVSKSLVASIVALARDLGVPVLVDPKHADLAYYVGASVVTPNAKEFLVSVGRAVDLDDDMALAAAAGQLADGAGLEALVVTLGARGMAIWQRGQPLARVKATARRVFDVTGAGDTAIATLALGLVAGLSLASAASVANRSAGLVVERPGAAVITVDELARAFPEPRRWAGPTPLPELEAALAWWRLRGEKIVFTNGCFDLLHTGHLSLLRQAAAEGDVLIVGLNSDASVQRLKGPTRPVNGEDDRAQLLTALDMVDAVVVFDADTPLELIRAVKPDVLVKGADYTVEQVVGGEDVLGWGGRVFLADLVASRSTTRLVERMRKDTGDGA